jgi:hypothetical protein
VLHHPFQFRLQRHKPGDAAFHCHKLRPRDAVSAASQDYTGTVDSSAGRESIPAESPDRARAG